MVKDPKAYKFGVEIECTLPYINQGWMDEMRKLGCSWHDDGSINSYGSGYEGVEIVTPPWGYNVMWRNLSKISKILDRYNVNGNSSCGLHVHISHRKFLITKYIKRLINVWLAVEDVLYATQPDSRFGNGYCRRLLRSYVQGTFDEMPANKDRLIGKIEGRYYSLNLQNLRNDGMGTLECRLHAYTTNHIKIRNWITLLRAIYAYALDDYDREEVRELFNMRISEEKINKVWEMIDLDPGVREFYNDRINKMLFERLALQQGKAMEYDEIKDKKNRIMRRFESVRNEVSQIENETHSITRAFSD